jgi:ribonuclease I
MIFRILNWFKRKENRKERKRATVWLGHGLWPRPLHSQPSLGPNSRPTTMGPREKKKKKKKKVLH